MKPSGRRQVTSARLKSAAPQVHVANDKPAAAKGGVLDLRTAKPARASRRPVQRAVIRTAAEPSEPTAPAAERTDRHAERLASAKAVQRSATISRFHAGEVRRAAPKSEVAAPVTEHHQELPAHAAAHHQALSELLAKLPDIKPAMPEPSSRVTRYAAGMAAIAILGGYIWVHNYPKLAIQTAGGKAGLSASLPSYMPSSFSLASTNTSPGLVTLNFKSPNQSNPLTIAQHRTSWDSSSLLDNYVAKESSDYTAVQGQGLTVYLFNDDQAAWVNHGVWYSIAGATRLSREQILKIAYSL